MAWISLFFIALSIGAAELPLFLTKHANDTLRFITMDGRYAYVQKKPGVLGLVSSFRSVDIMSDSSQSDYLVKGSRFSERILIEVIPNAHTEYNLIKNNKIYFSFLGNSLTKEIGTGKASKLHLQDEWVSYFDGYTKLIHIQNLETQKKYTIKLAPKTNAFFVPEVEMVNATTVVYTDTNEAGNSALVSFDLATAKSNVIYKSPVTGTKLELCQTTQYLAIGEFPHLGVSLGSKLMQIKFSNGGANLSGYSTIYESKLPDIGNIVCQPDAIYFVMTTAYDKKSATRISDVAKFTLSKSSVQVLSSLTAVTQLVEMNGRILVPLRGDFYVVEGKNNIGVDILKSLPTNNKEELPLDI